MVATILAITGGVVAFTLLAEILHGLRIRRAGRLAFGPSGKPAAWTHAAPFLRAAGAGLLAWGLLTLIYDVEPKVHKTDTETATEDIRHLVLVLDVSPSMRLEDAGPDNVQSRLHRGRDVLQSMFSRIAMGRYKISVVATYNGAVPVVIDTSDSEVVQNVLTDLPMHFAFKTGETRLFDGLEEAAKIAADFPRDTATIVVVSDGDTLPPTGMPKMPASVKGVLVVGVGDPKEGKFINGRHSRQDVSALRQMALRLGGTYHDGNKRHIASSVLGAITSDGERSALEKLTKREYALMATALGSGILSLVPLLLHLLGTSWLASRKMQGRQTVKGAITPAKPAVTFDQRDRA